LEIASHQYKLLLGPDYTEKNYPAVDDRGEMIWSEVDTDGREYLASRDVYGRKRLLKQAGCFARWPSLSPDGKKILYTQIDHTVEYWIAEGLLAPDSPLSAERKRTGELVSIRDAEADGPQQLLEEGPNRSPRRASPVQLHHR
jgi:Tol biopolymer transport system component